jgi:CDGSH-type Zn-finger protein/truncated hemoglobin YjbI
MSELESGQPGAEPEIRVTLDGPYAVTNIQELRNWLGEELATKPEMELCRCGQSSTKPFCDGTHATTSFSGAKDPKRVPDRRDTYEGQQIEIFDNRGICAHSGFCTDRLASVFHVGQEPFIAPSGGRLDEIIQAVRACPSGALSYGIDGVESRAQVDRARLASVEVSKDGPYRITGGVRLVDELGNDVPRVEGSSREHFSLCRCGHSQNKPFCSGMHWYVKFTDPVPSPDHEPTLFEWAGGFPALLRMTRIFYSKYVPQDPLVGPLFARMSPDHSERVAAWLSEVFGGSDFYSQQYGGYSRMISQHVGKCITEEQRARWVKMLCQSADDAMLPSDPEFRAGSSLTSNGDRVSARKTPSKVRCLHRTCLSRAGGGSATQRLGISALAPPDDVQQSVALPGPDDTVTFTQHIKPLFRRMDRESMSFVFDLWSCGDVRKHAPEILRRLESGTMPCDGAWPVERVGLFRRWIDSGLTESARASPGDAICPTEI